MKINTFLTSASALALALTISHSVNAADLGSWKDSPIVEETAAVSWSGIWIAAMGGIVFHNDKLNFDADDSRYGGFHEGIEVDGLGSEGLFGELQIGFDRHLTKHVTLGLFAGLNVDDAEFSASVNTSGGGGSSSARVSYEQEWGGVVGPRLGFANGNSLFYVAGGYAFGELGNIRLEESSGGSSSSGNLLPGQETDWNGFFAEIGMERKNVWDVEGLALKVAGRFTDYDSITLFQSGENNGDFSSSERATLDRDSLAIMVGLKYSPPIWR